MKIDDLKELIVLKDIAEVLGQEIKKSGARFWTECPFHNDKNPSFLLNDKFGYCFTCKESADAFRLVMQLKNCSFIEAAEFIASFYNVRLDSKENNTKKREELENRLNEALGLYQDNLNEECLNYLKKRGVNDESIKEFKLGYGINYKKIDDELKLHLFNERLIIPIFSNSKLVGFGARDLNNNSKIKYINSPESEIFKKSNLLFGLKPYHVKKANSVIVVEGYFDVILAHQFGYKNVVATLGTAFNDFHLKKLSNLAKQIVFLFDNDKAGYETSKKLAKHYINNEFCKIGQIDYQNCKDLGELLNKNKNALNIIRTKDLAMFLCEDEMKNYKSGENNIEVIKKITNILKSLNSAYLQSFYRTKICKNYNLDIKYFSLSIKQKKENFKPIYIEKSKIEASILKKCLTSKKDFEYTKTYINELFFKDFYDIAKKIFNGVALDEFENNQIELYASEVGELKYLISYKIKQFNLTYMNDILTSDLDASKKAEEIQQVQEFLKKLNKSAGLNAGY